MACIETVVVTVPGNVFVTGEISVVYGHKAIVAAVQRRMTVKAQLLSSTDVVVRSDVYGMRKIRVVDIPITMSPASDPLYPLLCLCRDLLKMASSSGGVSVTIESTIPAEAGMSSSGACVIATALAVSELLCVEIHDLFALVFPLQEWIHGGRASGAELASSEFGKVHSFVKSVGESGLVQRELARVEGGPFVVVVGDTHVRAPTALSVGRHVPTLISRRRHMVESCFQRIGELADHAVERMQAGDLAGLGEAMNENQNILRQLMISHPKLDDAIDEALAAGALGAKLSGGGWGGIMFALVHPESAETVAQAIATTGCSAWVTQLGGHGMAVERPVRIL